MIRQLIIQFFLFNIINIIHCKRFSWFPHEFSGRSNKKIILGELPEFETKFNEYEDFKQKLRSNYECSGECLDVYQYFLEFESNYPIDFKKVYQCTVVKFKF